MDTILYGELELPRLFETDDSQTMTIRKNSIDQCSSMKHKMGCENSLLNLPSNRPPVLKDNTLIKINVWVNGKLKKSVSGDKFITSGYISL